MQELRQEDSKVEVKGFEAKYYDILMDIITFGKYPSFIRKVIKDLNLKRDDRVLDFGAGTGRNALLMREYVDKGEIVALEIGEEMKEQFKKKSSFFSNIKLLDRRIDEPLDFKEEFDVVFISFVLHGFIQKKREIIIQNTFNALKKGGRFAILDYSNFDVDSAPWYVKFAIRKVECPLAEDFIKRDTKKMLKDFGFDRFEENFYFKNFVRLLQAYKPL